MPPKRGITVHSLRFGAISAAPVHVDKKRAAANESPLPACHGPAKGYESPKVRGSDGGPAG